MRVWQYTSLNVTGVGGVETHIAAVSAELTKSGHEVHIGEEAPQNWLSDSSTPLIAHTHGDLWPSPKTIWKLRRNASSKWIQVCHGTSVGRVLACSEYFSLSGWKGSLRDFLPTHLANGAIAVSEQALSEARRYFRMRLPARVIPNGANTSVFKPLEAIASDPRVMFLGRGEDRVKNTVMLLEACREIASEHPDFKLVAAPGITANGAEFPFLRNLGPTFGQDLAKALSRCRAIVLCSLYEGDPVVLHEAKALGIGVVASDLPQLRANLEGYSNSWFIDPKNPKSLVEGLQSALFSKPSLEPTPKARDWAQVAKEFEEFYLSLLK